MADAAPLETVVVDGAVRGPRAEAAPALRSVWREGSIVAARALADLIAILAALAISRLALPFRVGGRADGFAVWALLWWVGIVAAGPFWQRGVENATLELRRTVRAVGIVGAFAIVATFLVGLPLPKHAVSVAWALGFAAVPLERWLLRKLVFALRRRGRLRRRVLIVGPSPSGRAIAETIASARWEGLDLAGFVALDGIDPAELLSTDGVVGTAGELPELVARMGIAEVIIASSVTADGRFAEVVAKLDGVPVDLRVAVGFEGFLPSRVAIQPIGDRPMLTVHRAGLQPVARVAKRVLDLVLTSSLLVLAAPVIALCGIAIRLDSRGPALFRQQRMGIEGREFTLFKLRTMVLDAEARRPELEQDNESDGILFKIREDPRVTRVGGFLRRMSLDELPQLLNVLAGDMSLVGPRPPLPDEVSRYDPRTRRRLLVKPGITGLWQVNRLKLSFEEYERYDLLYVQNWSIALDLYILAKTIPAVLSRRGAY